VTKTVPGGDTVLGEGDVLILYATDGDFRRIEEVHSGKKEQA
jgi:Trk K+ transport system NAD-binding subunit